MRLLHLVKRCKIALVLLLRRLLPLHLLSYSLRRWCLRLLHLIKGCKIALVLLLSRLLLLHLLSLSLRG